MDINAYRRAYFAICKSLGLDDATRHGFNYAICREASTRNWTPEQWRTAVAELQRRAGQDVQPGRPHIRGSGAGTPGGMITPAQLAKIQEVAALVQWRTAPEAFVRARLLSPMRRAGWSGQWEDLFRAEASNVIRILLRMATQPAVQA